MTNRIQQLRQIMAEQNLDAILVPQTDEWQGEYIAPYAQRLKWLTSFDGSAGIAAITIDKAALFVDGRYTIAAKKQVDCSLFDILQMPQNKLSDWLNDALPQGGRIGYDSWLFTVDWAMRMEKAFITKNLVLIPCDINPIDTLWQEQPDRPASPVFIHKNNHAGQSSKQKCAAIAEALKKNNVDSFLITAADSVAWLFNIRSNDVPHTPYVLARALVHADGTAHLVIHPSRITKDVRNHIGTHVTVIAPDMLANTLYQMGKKGSTTGIASTSCPKALSTLIYDAHITPVKTTDPCEKMKACKTNQEIKGSRKAHIDDAIALIKFFKWVEESYPSNSLSEWTLSERLHTFRAESPAFKEDSFEAIIGWNAHGAIVHYRVTPESSQPITGDGLLLIDSGGQYDNGTTDITRTIALGTPSDEMKDRYTRVVKGHIALSTARFPIGTTGVQLDALARKPLWDIGLDYAHGTGHGVGAYLSVHEGPASISPRGKAVPLQEGMILSNEPGYYKEDVYGIRFENLVLVVEDTNDNDEQNMLTFETLSLFPIDAKLLDKALLTKSEKAWINDYHSYIYNALAPNLNSEQVTWLKDKTRRLERI